MFDITITGAEDAERRLRNLSANMDSISARVMYEEMEAIVALLEGDVKRLTPTDTGTLRNSIFSEVNVSGTAITGLVSTPLVYGPPMEFSRKPGKMPPADALKSWARRKLGDEKLAFVVARAIGRRGIQAHEMFQNAWANNTSRVASMLQTIGVHVSEELLRNL